MRVIDRTEIKMEWSDLEAMVLHPHPTKKRSPGVHVSQVIKYCAQKLGKLSLEDQVDEMPLVVLLGIAWEEIAARLYSEMKWQPGEVKRNGVIGSPDGYSKHDMMLPNNFSSIEQLTELPVIDEFKFTYKSARHRHDNIIGEWMWMQQVMAYINMNKRMQEIVKGGWPMLAKLHVCWAMGEYGKYPLKPRYVRYLVKFDKQDLDNNWAMLQRYKSYVEPEKGH